jgi:hypothetical protein
LSPKLALKLDFFNKCEGQNNDNVNIFSMIRSIKNNIFLCWLKKREKMVFECKRELLLEDMLKALVDEPGVLMNRYIALM